VRKIALKPQDGLGLHDLARFTASPPSGAGQRGRPVIGLLTAAALASGGAASAAPDWKAFAACSAAYEINAQVAEPGRTASMRAMISEVAGDYRKAAADILRKAARASSAGADKTVADEIARREAEYRSKPRKQVEQVIDACPQLPDPE
jgi:hypothetical protein